MKILLTCDIHNGYGDGEASLWAMNMMREYAHRNNISDVVVLGDLFDRRDHIAIDILSGVYEFFRSADVDYKQSWIIFPGNHDMFLRNSWDINSLQCLKEHTHLIEKISKFIIDNTTFWVVPFIHHEDSYMEAVNKINDMASPNDVLLTHIGVCGAILNQCFLNKNWSIVSFKDTKFKHVFTGHFHMHQAIGNVVYPGSPVPFRFDEGMSEHGFIVFDTTTSTWEFVNLRSVAEEYGSKIPPDFVTIIDSEDYPDIENLIKGNNIKFIQTRDYTHHEMEEIRAKYEKMGIAKLFWNKQHSVMERAESVDIKSLNVRPIMEMYLENDLPADVNPKLILKMDEEISKQADEKLASEEEVVEYIDN